MKQLLYILIIFTSVNFINSGQEESIRNADTSSKAFSESINRSLNQLFTISENLAMISVAEECFNIESFFVREDACKLIVEQLAVSDLSLKQIETLNKHRMQILQMWYASVTKENAPIEMINAYSFMSNNLQSALCLAYDIIENKAVPKAHLFLR